MSISLTIPQAQRLHLAAQGLLAPPKKRATKASVLAAIERMQVLQIDTIHVVARSPYLVLFSRLGRYDPKWLDTLLEEGAIFECWSHEACFAPRSSFPLHRRHLLEQSSHWSARLARTIHGERPKEMAALLERVRANGPVRSTDFASEKKGKGGWWGWKAEKRLAESWFALGELMITRRDSFQRVYDLRERVLEKVWPGWSDDLLPSPAEVRRDFILGAVSALGIAPARWIADYFRSEKKLRDKDLDPLVEEGLLVRADVEGWEHPGYIHPSLMPEAEAAAGGGLRATHTTVLSPFDPIVWDRVRAAAFFGFDYRLECYTPAPKRVYGYYVLPILDRGKLIGRLDAKAHRADEYFEIKSLYLEKGVEVSDALADRVARALIACAEWHRAPEVVVKPRGPFAKLLRAQLGRGK